MRRTLVLLATLLAASLFSAQPSRAQFAECSDRYISSFRSAGYGWSPGQVDCDELWRFEFATPDGPRWIRLIGDRTAGTARLPIGGVEIIRAGALRAANLMAQLGEFRIHNVTMMIGPPSAPGEPEAGHAIAWTGSRDIQGEGEACHVVLLLRPDFTAQDVKHTIGHELFHCIENASLSEQQWRTVAGNGAWWGEGAAEEFGALVAGGVSGLYNRVPGFEGAVSARQPLYEMSYSAAIFFFWHYREHGLDALMPFLRQMTGSAGAAAQMTAMSAALPAEDWRHFAQAYDDRRIRHPSGAPLPFGEPIEGEIWFIDETDTFERELRRFVIETGWADYGCGAWANEVNASSIEVRHDGGVDWGPWPASLDTEGRDSLRIATMTSLADVDLRLATDKREACRTCDVSRAIDSCVVGRWRQTGGGPLEYLRSRGVPITMVAQDPLVLTMTNEGTFSTNAIRTSAQVVQQMPHGNTMNATGGGTSSPVLGRWSARGGILQGCIDSGGELEGETLWPNPPEADMVSRMTGRGPYTGRTPWSGSAAGATGGTPYTCSDTTLSTSSRTEYGPMTYTFTRETPPQPRR